MEGFRRQVYLDDFRQVRLGDRLVKARRGPRIGELAARVAQTGILPVELAGPL